MHLLRLHRGSTTDSSAVKVSHAKLMQAHDVALAAVKAELKPRLRIGGLDRAAFKGAAQTATKVRTSDPMAYLRYTSGSKVMQGTTCRKGRRGGR